MNYVAGKDIDAFCRKCDLTLAHVIVAVAGIRIAKVQCKTCGGIHAYRGAASAKSPAKPRTKAASTTRASKAKGATKAQLDVLQSVHPGDAQPYKATTEFTDGDVIQHVRFGLGVVTRIMADQKIEVLFQEGAKVLIHGR